MSENIPEIFSNEQNGNKKKMDVVVGGKKYRPEFEFQLQKVEYVPSCVCCGKDDVLGQFRNIEDYKEFVKNNATYLKSKKELEKYILE